MLYEGGRAAYIDGWRTTMPQTFSNIFNAINFTRDSIQNNISEEDLKKIKTEYDLNESIKDFQSLKNYQKLLESKILDSLYKDKFNGIFSPPLRNEFQILNFWGRYGFRSMVVEHYFSYNSSSAQLTAIETFEKWNNSWWNGEIVVKGDPKFRVGKVVELTNIPAKFYCFSVSHDFVWGESYKTTIGIMMGKLIKTPTNESKNGKRSEFSQTIRNPKG